jgi:hypothetical protein
MISLHDRFGSKSDMRRPLTVLIKPTQQMTVSKDTWSAKFVRTLTAELGYAPRLRLHRCRDLDRL